MRGDVVPDKLHDYCAHIDALSCRCRFEAVVKTDLEIDVHAFYPCSFHLLDRFHLLPLEMSLYGFEYLPPVPRKLRGGGKTGLGLPGTLAEQDHDSQLCAAELQSLSHRT